MRCVFPLLAMLLCIAPRHSIAQSFSSPDILVLGDSQITFGAGPAYLKFFKTLQNRCPASRSQTARLQSVAVIGVRSAALHDWSAKTTKGKSDICDVDPKLKRNAGAYGSVNTAREKYVQIGQGRDFQFCKSGKSPLQAALAPDYYTPKLLVISALGNATERWNKSPPSATQDLGRILSQIPQTQPCIIMTTAPSFRPAVNENRLMAQATLARAFAGIATHCSFVRGITPASIKAMTRSKHNFRITKTGQVQDPFHPTHRGATKFLSAIRKDLCRAIKDQTSG